MNKIKAVFSPYGGLPKEIYVIFISRIINNLGCFVHPLLALILTQKIGLTKDVAGVYITILAIISAPSLILGGKLVDTIGRRNIILISQSLGAIALICCGFMKPTLIMVYILMLSSILYSLSAPAYDAMLADLTTPENRKASYSLIYMGLNIGFAIGPIIGGLLFKNHLSLVFIGDGITTLLSLVLVMLYVKETIGKDKEIVLQEDREQEKEVTGSVFSVLLSRPILLFFSIILFFYSFEYSQWGFTLPLHLGQIFNSSGAAYYGILASVNGVIVILLTPVISIVTHSVKPIRVIAIGGAFYGIAFGAFSFIRSFPLFLIFIIIMTMGEIMISINSSTFIANHTPSSHRGRVSSILPLISGTGYALGPMAMGKFVTKYNFTFGWSIIGIIGFISAFAMFMLQRMDKQDI
jgi:MFS family permease